MSKFSHVEKIQSGEDRKDGCAESQRWRQHRRKDGTTKSDEALCGAIAHIKYPTEDADARCLQEDSRPTFGQLQDVAGHVDPDEAG